MKVLVFIDCFYGLRLEEGNPKSVLLMSIFNCFMDFPGQNLLPWPIKARSISNL